MEVIDLAKESKNKEVTKKTSEGSHSKSKKRKTISEDKKKQLEALIKR